MKQKMDSSDETAQIIPNGPKSDEIPPKTRFWSI